SVPISMIFLTGDSVINPLAVQSSGVDVSWFQWFLYMGPPNIITSILTCILILILFKPTQEVKINKKEIKEKLKLLGKMSIKEKKTIVWLTIAVVLWLTDSIHGINIGWITLLIAMLMSFPYIGEVLYPKQWTEVPVHVLLFLNAAITIGKVGAVTGMNTWIANTILPANIPSSPYILALTIAIISIGIHMFLGSVIAVMGIAIPALLIFTEPMSINPIVTTLLVYTSIGIHYVLPFHHLNILVGQGEDSGMYSQREAIKLGIPLTLVVFLVIIIEVTYWKIIGLF
ncbi:MAG: anion permease, partial [Tissierellales bacterium]|nr:anion permease [Tissierellales bacterium]